MWRSEYWRPALGKLAEATGMSIKVFGVGERGVILESPSSRLVGLFLEYGFDPGLFTECARRCLNQTGGRPPLVVEESHGLMVVGTSLVLEGAVVGAAVIGYAFATFTQVPTIRRWAESSGVPFARLWDIARTKQPMPQRRLILYGELLQVLGDSLLREHRRSEQFEDAVVKLQAADMAKDEFLAVVSHELRTPLAAILGWASVLKIEAPERLRPAAEAIERNARIESRMIEDLIDVDRVRRHTVKLEIQTEDLPQLVRAAADTLAQELKRKALRLELIGTGEPLPVKADAGRLQQVFRNILSNAVKFTPAGGGIRITLGRQDDNALVVIADTGAGISPEFLPFVFDMFRQQEQGPRRSQEGLGIGLALVKQLIELHKGTVSIASAGVGRGSEVTVRLPLADGMPAPDEPAAVAAAAPRGKC